MGLDADDLDALERQDAERARRREAARDDVPEWQKPLRFSRDEYEMPAPGPGPSAPIYVSEIDRPALLAPGTFNFVVVDRDNASGQNRHAPAAKIVAVAVSSEMVKDRLLDQWEMHLGVITRIDGATADLSFVRFGSLHIAGQDVATARETMTVYPFELDLEARAGALVRVSPSFVVLNDPTVNTATPLTGPLPAPLIVPAVGDLILRVIGVGNQNALAHVAVWYRGEGAP